MIAPASWIQSTIRKVAGKCSRKIIAVDFGSSHIKILYAEDCFGRVRLLRHHVMDLQEEGLLSADEVNRHLRDWAGEIGEEPVALVLAQHLSLAHIIDLPRASQKDMRAMIQRDTVNFSGLSETSTVSDYRRLRPFGKVQNPYWVGIAKEQEVQKLLGRLGSEESRSPVCDVVSAATALAAAFLAQEPGADRVVLADLGATSTVVAILDQGQCIYTSSYPIGSESFTSAIASLQKCSFEEAEAIKRAMNLFTGAEVQPGFLSVVNVWLQDLVKLLKEWEGTNPEIHLLNPPCRIYVSGGGSCQPGLMDYLKSKRGLNIDVWPQPPELSPDAPVARYAIAWGAVLGCFGKTESGCSLLPLDMRRYKKRADLLMSMNWMCLGVCAVLLCLLALGSAHKLFLGSRIADMASDAKAALIKAEDIELLVQNREQEYGKMLPVAEAQKKTMDVIQTLQYMQQMRESKDMWFLLLADQASYMDGAAQPPPDTNALTSGYAPIKGTNQAARNSLVMGLTISGQPEERLAVVRDIRASLKKQPLYQQVDRLPTSLINTNVHDPRVALPDRHYSLLLDLTPSEKPQPLRTSPPQKPEAGAKP
jgi:Tfp pilus assembly PilM family ATPase